MYQDVVVYKGCLQYQKTKTNGSRLEQTPVYESILLLGVMMSSTY